MSRLVAPVAQKTWRLSLSYGDTPLADRLLTKDQLNEPEIMVPLTLVFCSNCKLVQIRETVDPKILFYSDYPYFSSVSQSLLKHFEKSAQQIITTRGLSEDSLVIEAASNDGYMLKNFVSRNIPVLGIDPAEAPARDGSGSWYSHSLYFLQPGPGPSIKCSGENC